jgi:uncharacterized C2H2 Zn-finger protein
MKKGYKCVRCPGRSFQNQFALTAHLRFCKNGGRTVGKDPLKCPECGEIFNRKGLGSHRKSAHDIAGTSRWRKYAKTTKNGNGVLSPSSQMAKTLRGQAEQYRVKAEKLEKLAAELETIA